MAKRPKRNDECIMQGCKRDSLPYSDMCNRCKSWIRYWKGKPKAQFMKRVATIDFWSERAHGVAGKKRG